MKITHRDFYLEVTRKQDELLTLSEESFWPEVNRLMGLYPEYGDVKEMFAEMLAGIGIRNNWQAEEFDSIEDWKPYAKFAAMNHVFSLPSGDWRDEESAPFPFPVRHREPMNEHNEFAEVDREVWHDSTDRRDWTDSEEEFE